MDEIEIQRDNTLCLPFDLYARNKIVSDVINARIAKSNRPLKILDVGGRSGHLREFLHLNCELWILDIREPEQNEENHYVIGDIIRAPFDDNTFDVVTSQDVFEHISPENRLKALEEMRRISKDFIILAAPFYSEDVERAEKLANEFFFQLTNKDHPWLIEHIKNGLPKQEVVEKFVKEYGLNVRCVKSNNLGLWLLLQQFIFYAYAYSLPTDKVKSVYQYYNSNFENLGDSLSPTYRKIYFISKSITFEHLPEFLDQHFEASKYLDLINMIGQIKDPHIQNLSATIGEIEGTFGWNILNKFRAWKDEILKHDITRRHIYYLILYIINKSNIRKSIYYLKNYGIRAFIEKAIDKLKNIKIQPYQLWIEKNEPKVNELKEQKKTNFAYEPRISIIVPTFNTPKQFLTDMIESVLTQTYSNWELCIADGASKEPHVREILEVYTKRDARIKLNFLKDNKGIAGNSNEALSLATGDFVALLDHDDILAPFALFEIVKAINENLEVDFIYSDEDKISEDGKRRFDPHFKPDWSPDTLRSYNYITHLTVIKRMLLDKVGWFREGYDGSQDYDLILRATEQAKRITHIPKILYYWRVSQNSAAGNPYAKLYAYEAAKKALADHIKRIGLSGTGEDGLFLSSYKISYNLNIAPKISIIIPNSDHAEDLKKCVKSIMDKSTYRNFEIIIVENGSSEEKTFKLYDDLRKLENIKIITWDKSFNHSAVNNYAVNFATGEVLLFLDKMEVISPDWIERMLEHAVRKDVGAVGAKLYYPDGTVQHAGVILKLGGLAGHSHKYFARKSFGYRGRLKIVQNLSAVAGACLMIRKDVFGEVGGFDEGYSHTFNDIDLCLKIRERGYLIIYTPYAELYHHESLSRGYEDTPEKQARFKREIEYFQKKWKDVLIKGDPYYNPNLTLDKEDFSIKI